MANRLPTPGGDQGSWGQILNDYLSVEHNADGTLKNVSRPGDGTIIADGSVTASKLSSPVNSYLASAQTAVQSVNGKSGQAVTLAAGDVAAIPTSQKGVAGGVAALSSSSGDAGKAIDAYTGLPIALSSTNGVVSVDSYLGVTASVEAAVLAAINAATANNTRAGVVRFTAGVTYTLTSTPIKIPANLIGLEIDLQYAIIKPGSTARRCFDWDKQADYDTFQNVRLRRGVVDCENIGGKHHVVIGPWQGGSWQRKINLNNILVEDWRLINVPVGDGTTNFRIGVHIGMAASPATDTRCTATNCVVRNIRSDGCLQLVAIHGVPVNAETTANVYHDNILVENIEHLLPTTPTAFGAGAHIMAGTKGTGGRITIRNITGKNSPDVGIEYDGWQTAVLDNITVEDAYDAAFYHVNYNPAERPEAQTSTHINCVAVRRLVDSHGQGFVAEIKNSNRPGVLIFGPGCKYHRLPTSAGFQATPFLNAPGEAGSFYGVPRLQGELQCILEYPDYNNASNAAPAAVWVSNADTTNRCALDVKIKARVTGSRSGTGTVDYRTLVLRDGAFTDMDVDVRSDVSFSGAGNASLSHVHIGSVDASVTSVFSGRLKLTIPANSGGGGNTPVGIRGESQAFNSIESNNRLLVVDSDFAGLAASSSNLSLAGDGTFAKGIHYSNVRWRDGSQLAGQVSATGTTNLSNRFDMYYVSATGAAKTTALPTIGVTPSGKGMVVVDSGGDAATNNITITIQSSGTFTDGTSSKTITTNGGVRSFVATPAGWALV